MLAMQLMLKQYFSLYLFVIYMYRKNLAGTISLILESLPKIVKGRKITNILSFESAYRPLDKVHNEKLIFLFLNQNICCGYSKELSQWDGTFEHQKHMLKLMDKKIFTTLRSKFLFLDQWA